MAKGNKNTKNTLLTPQSTKPFSERVPFKNPLFQQTNSHLPPKVGPKFNTAFRNQNRGSGGK
jgi:hypothetical protein